MSHSDANEPTCNERAGAIAVKIEGRPRDLGGFSVRRVLPAARRRMVGPFVFFDHMGPAVFPPGQGIQVRPHPHIGLATITYLFEGQIMHRDSLGFVQPIRAGAVNLMTAGRGIVHSERAGEDLNELAPLNGIQSWIALPTGQEEMEPGFVHYPAPALPQIEHEGVTVRIIMGEAFERRSPVPAHSPTLYLDCRMSAGSQLSVPHSVDELAAYVAEGRVQIDQRNYGAGAMAVVCAKRGLELKAAENSRVMVIGGSPVGERHIWWNFVSSSKERIEQAKADWKEGRFDKVPGEIDSIPLPD